MLANKIHHIDCLQGLAMIPEKSIQTSVSSPPYWGLRNYGIEPTAWPEVKYKIFGFEIVIPAGECCLGLEETPEAFVGHMVLIYRGVWRALKDDGTAWVNMGDTYIGGKGANGASRTGMDGHEPINVNALMSTKPGEFRPQDRPHSELKAKDMAGIPWMLAFALRADGWYLRQDVIWHKKNCMPESTKDRCTKNHEYLFLLSKKRKYYFDQEAIMEPLAASSIERLNQDTGNQNGSPRGNGGLKHNGNMRAVRKGNRKTFRGGGKYTSGQSFDNSILVENDSIGNEPNELDVRNKRSVWSVATQGFKEAHFATFPFALITDCIKAGSKEGDIVLDMFMGSGTTAIVASKLGRHFVGFELSGDYMKISDKRVASELGIFIPAPFEIKKTA